MSAARPRLPIRYGLEPRGIRIGFVPLIDAAPLIVAAELGYFADEGLDVRLEKQIGWGNVRDRLTYAELHASHAPIGMVPASVAGLTHYHQPFTLLARLGAGGNAITISTTLADLGDSPARWRQRLGRPINLAYVFSVASHHYALRRLLHDAGLDAERDARLSVLPPAQMNALLRQGTIDGFCAGEPWNTLAMTERSGAIFRATTELVPNHPEKGLIVTQRWLADNEPVAERLTRAAIRGCDFCEESANRSRLAELLASPSYLAMDERVIERSLAIDEWFRTGTQRASSFRSFAREATVPDAASVEWVVNEMIHWGQLPATTHVAHLAKACIADASYARAIETLGPPNLSNNSKPDIEQGLPR